MFHNNKDIEDDFLEDMVEFEQEVEEIIELQQEEIENLEDYQESIEEVSTITPDLISKSNPEILDLNSELCEEQIENESFQNTAELTLELNSDGDKFYIHLLNETHEPNTGRWAFYSIEEQYYFAFQYRYGIDLPKNEALAQKWGNFASQTCQSDLHD